MDFGGILIALKDGKRVRRKAWAATVWIRLYHPYSDREFSIRENGGAYGFDSGTLMSYLALHTAHNTFEPWPISLVDILAEDWEIVRSES